MKMQEKQNLEHLYSDEIDLGNSLSSLRLIDTENSSDIFQVLSSISPTTIYESIDIFSQVIN